MNSMTSAEESLEKNLDIERKQGISTLEKLTPAPEKIRERAGQMKAESISAGDLIEKKFPSDQYWVGKGLIPKGGYVLLAGPAKEGKTTLALQLSLCLVSKVDFVGEFPIKEEARVLYLFAENSLPGLQKLLQKQTSGAEQLGWTIPRKAMDENFILQPSHKLSLDSKDDTALLDELVGQHDPDVIFLDPISLFTGRDVNKLHNATKLINILSNIEAKRDCTWVVVHHYRKPSEQKGQEVDSIYRVLGSSGFGNHCESFLGIERAHRRRSSHYKKLEFLLRREETPGPLYLYRNPETLLFEPVDQHEAIRGRVCAEDVIRILKHKPGGKASHSTIVSCVWDELGIGKGRTTQLLNKAEEKGLVAKEDGHYGEWYVL